MNKRDYTMWNLAKWTWCATLKLLVCQPSTVDLYGQVSFGHLEIIMMSVFSALLCFQPSKIDEFVIKRQMVIGDNEKKEVIFSKVRIDQERMCRLQ
jgi:hypothetical protein